MSKYKGTPTSKEIIAPEGGWDERCVYIVEVAFSSVNLIHESLFYTGFLDEKGEPSSYNKIFNPGYEDEESIDSVYFMKAIGKLPESMQVFK